jgi:iron complex outermembrane receptor protein
VPVTIKRKRRSPSPEYAPETLDSFETGFKTSWLANRLQIDGAAFYYQYRNQQLIDVRPTGQQPLINLDRSRIVGAELDLVAKPAASLTLHAGLGFLDTQVQKGAVAGGSVDISGHQLPDAPRTSGTLAVDWDAMHALGGEVVVHLDATYAAKQYFELMNEDRIAQPAYTVAAARIAFHGADDRYEVGVWGRNLTDKFYLVSALDLQAFGFDYRHRGQPRMFGADAALHF